ncbi:hypothetical protein D9O40_12310 [Clostridium autoethanogenum]|uniref:Flagellar hook-associated protein 2 n=1 Tax=Clostridium autoethanogenum TaxID=84023 RepID=A0A3M0SWQ1_9CLOT|nr:flagellar filament capping protein FliD [Clostridium autoethanogenum]RMC99077.1 hypothetical protein D9O40_12310 [Clostridium autoethanogenum]
MSDSTSSIPAGTTGAGGGDMLRITGMNTGLDVDAIVKKMLAGDQAKLDQAKQSQQLIQWKQDAYKTIISDIEDVQKSFFDISDSANYLLNSDNYSNMNAVSDNTALVNATAQTGAAAGTYKISVSQVAQSAVIGGTSSLSSNAKLNSISSWSGKTITFNDGTSYIPITIDSLSDTATASDLVSSINQKITSSSLAGKVSVSYIKNDSGEYINFNPLDSDSSIKIVSNTAHNTTTDDTDISDLTSLISSDKNLISASTNTKLTDLGDGLDGNIVLNLDYNGKEISVQLDNSSSGKNGSATVGDLISAISNATGGAVTGKFDDTTGKFTLQTTATGSTSSLKIEDWMSTHEDGDTQKETTSSLLTALGMSDELGVSSQGSDAQVTITGIDGSKTTMTQSSNRFTVNGINYNVTGVTTSDVSISVTSDTTKIYDKISNFIDKYNKVMYEIQTKLTEKGDKDYPPLTDAKKSAMSSDDIKNYEARAKQGVLRNDQNLENLMYSLRSAFSDIVQDGNGNNAASIAFGRYGTNAIGIDLSSDPEQPNELVIADSSKLRDAIANHGDQVLKLFATTYNSALNNRYNVTNLSNWSGSDKTINLQSSSGSAAIDMSGFAGTSLNDLATYINDKIKQTSLKDTVSVSTIVDASGTNHIKFTTLGDLNMTATGISDLPTSSIKMLSDDDAKFNQSGIFARVKGVFEDNVGMVGTSLNNATLTKFTNYQDDYSLFGGTGNTLPDQLYQKQLLIKNITSQMSDDSQKYYNQFVQLEVAMQRLNSQQSALSMYSS